MRKKLGIFIGEIAQDYQKLVVQTIVNEANSLGYDVIVNCSYGSYNDDYLFSEGEKATVHLLDCSIFDGIVVAEDVFDIAGMPDELFKVIDGNVTCPVVYLRTTRDGYYSVVTENKKSIESIVRHFTDVHGFRDICYMSGKAGSEDSEERLKGYLSVMKEHGIEVNDHMIFHGDFWRYKGKEAVEWFMEGRDTYPEAIVCANDYMAISICQELKVRGVRVPEDVCVSGFDFIDEARRYIPTLTSLEIDFETMASKAMEIIDSVNSGREAERIRRVPARMCIHRSCGCGGQYDNAYDINYAAICHEHVYDTKNTLVSVTAYQYAFGFDEYMSIADFYKGFLRSSKAYICFNDPEEKGANEVENDCTFTDRMVLRRIFQKDKPTEKMYIQFPRKKIIPDEYWKEDEPNNLFIFTLHFKNIIQGYIVCDYPQTGWFDVYTQGYLMTLANAIENGEVHKKMEHLESIRAIYQNDALTGILNRRGFDKMLQDRYIEARGDDVVLGIASIDMDNLKVVNDTYGHAEGDKALMVLAKALSSVMKENDFCARVGGDEFSAVVAVSYPGRCNEFKKEFNDALVRECRCELDYMIEASVGICETSEYGASSLVACIQLADKRMYEEKRSRKQPR